MRNLDRIGKPIVLKPKRIQLATPCADELTTVLNCWRSLGVDATSCAEVSKSLMTCMAKRVLFLTIIFVLI